jgi:hypothetical protein
VALIAFVPMSVSGAAARIGAVPEYWHEDALLLCDGDGRTKIDLTPRQPGRDLSEFRDTFWRVLNLKGATPVSESTIVNIGERDITISTPSGALSVPFGLKLSGLQFYPAWRRTTKFKNSHDRQTMESFEVMVQRIAAYESKAGKLTFSDRAGQILLVLEPLRSSGIENRRWRIAAYRPVTKTPKGESKLIDTQYRAEITFLQGEITGSPGCGGWDGSYKISGDTITIHADFVLAGLCLSGPEAQNGLLVPAINGQMRIAAEENRVVLKSLDGQTKIILLPYWNPN